MGGIPHAGMGGVRCQGAWYVLCVGGEICLALQVGDVGGDSPHT